MGFNYNKRIKLGKGFGLHISKSGITPSYRTKRGSLSSKGYSIKTGIPGVIFKRNCKKPKGNGCLILLILSSVLLLTTAFITIK